MLIVICLISIVTISREFYNLFEAISKGSQGIDITNFYPSSGLNTLIMASLILFFLYILIISPLAVIYRQYFNMKLNKADFTQEGKIFKVKLPGRFFTGLFFAFGRMNLINVTCANTKVDFSLKPVSFEKNGQFEFDLTDLPSAKYKIECFIFHLKGPFGIINARILYESRKKIFLYVFADRYAFFQFGKKRDTTSEEMKTQFRKKPTEEFFAVREYRWGDELKKINWKKTAKERTLMVRIPENKPVNQKDLKIVLNTFAPFIKSFSQHKIIGKFIDESFMYLKGLLKNRQGSVDLFLNGKQVEVIKNIEKYNIDKLALFILEKIVFQQKRNFNKFNESQEIEKPIVFSLSIDLISSQAAEKRFIHFVSEADKFSLKERLKSIFFDKKINYFGISLEESIEKINFVGGFKDMIRHYKYMRAFKNFEKVYKDNKDVIKMNSEKT